MSQVALKIHTACMNPAGPDRPQGNKHGEYVLLKRHGAHPVKGYTVEQTVYDHNGTTHYQAFKTLTSELPVGTTEVLIRNGDSADHMDGTRLVTYTGHRVWALNNKQGETLRLRDAQGSVVDERHFPANFCAALPPAPQPPKATPPVVSAAAAVAHGEAR